MKLALIERDMEWHNKPDTPSVPGQIKWCAYDYQNRIITFVVEHDDGVELPTLTESAPVQSNVLSDLIPSRVCAAYGSRAGAPVIVSETQ